jgi:hypothetical protein
VGSQPTSKTLVVSPSKVKAGQTVKVSGGGCNGVTVLIFFIDNKEFHRGYTKSGNWAYQLKLPRELKSGDHDMWAECKGTKHKPARFHVDKGKKSKRSFNAYPDTVTRGDKVWVEGTGCKKWASVKIRLDGETVKRTHADKWGTFDKGLRLPHWIKKGRHVLSAKCDGRFLGSDGIKVKKRYEHDRDHVYADRSAVQAGKKLRVRGDDCPDGKPVASLDGAPVALNVSSKAKGFTAEATIPAGTAPGKHRFYAGCDAGSASTTELNVLDPEDTEEAAAQEAFGPQPISNLAMWAGLFAGLAPLVASVFVSTRRRGTRG